MLGTGRFGSCSKMRIVVAPQEFKGTLAAAQAAEAMAEGVRRAMPDAAIDVIPLSDGGPGLIEAIRASRGGAVVAAVRQDPPRRAVPARWVRNEGGQRGHVAPPGGGPHTL